MEVSKGRFGGDGTWDFETKAVSKARFGGDQRLGVSEPIAKLQRWAYWVFGSAGKESWQDEARHGMAWHGMSCHGMAWYCSVWQGEAKHGNARHDEAVHVKTRQYNRFGVYCASRGPVIILR